MAQTFNSQLPSLAARYIAMLNAKVTISGIKKSVFENTYFPSLLALSDTFDRLNIPNEAYKIDKDNFQDLKSETPFITLINIPTVGSDFVIVNKINNENVHYSYKGDKIEINTLNEFLSKYKGVVWKAETNEQSGEINYLQNQKNEKAIKFQKTGFGLMVILLYATLFSYNVNQSNILSFSSIALFKTVGLCAAVLLLVFEIDKSNAFVQSICSVNSKTNCDAVLSSTASKIAGISWGEIGFFYFAATTIGLFIPNIPFGIKATWLAIGNICAVPYVFFSIYYQWKVVKQWCPLCLAVQMVLIFELIWSINNIGLFSFVDIFQLKAIFSILFYCLLPIVFWYLLKPILVKSQNHDQYLAAFKRLQNNPEIFQSLLLQQTKAPDGWQEIGIDAGNPNAENTIIKVCNPYCGPCAKMHSKIEDLLKGNANVKLKIIFINGNNEIDKGTIVVKHLLAIAEKDNAIIEHALESWYLTEKKEYEILADAYPINGELKTQGNKVEAMAKWCKDAEVTHTPTIYLNGYKLPENYTIEELKNIL